MAQSLTLLVDGKSHTITVDDPDTFNQPWQGTKLFQKRQGTLLEEACSENNAQFEYNIPIADKPDF